MVIPSVPQELSDIHHLNTLHGDHLDVHLVPWQGPQHLELGPLNVQTEVVDGDVPGRGHEEAVQRDTLHVVLILPDNAGHGPP